MALTSSMALTVVSFILVREENMRCGTVDFSIIQGNSLQILYYRHDVLINAIGQVGGVALLIVESTLVHGGI